MWMLDIFSIKLEVSAEDPPRSQMLTTGQNFKRKHGGPKYRPRIESLCFMSMLEAFVGDSLEATRQDQELVPCF